MAVAKETTPVVETVKYVGNEGLPRAIVVDVDETLLHTVDGVESVDESVANLVKAFAPTHRVIILTARDASIRPETEMSLSTFGVPYHELIMRPAGDTRDDSVVKAELFTQLIGDNYNVKFAVDDDNTVVEKCWQALGVKVFHVIG